MESLREIVGWVFVCSWWICCGGRILIRRRITFFAVCFVFLVFFVDEVDFVLVRRGGIFIGLVFVF